MAELTPTRIELRQINGNQQFKNGDVVTPEVLNSAIQGAAYAQKKAEEALALAEAGGGSGSGGSVDLSNYVPFPTDDRDIDRVPLFDKNNELVYLDVVANKEVDTIPLRRLEDGGFQVGSRLYDDDVLSMNNFGKTKDNCACGTYIHTTANNPIELAYGDTDQWCGNYFSYSPSSRLLNIDVKSGYDAEETVQSHYIDGDLLKLKLIKGMDTVEEYVAFIEVYTITNNAVSMSNFYKYDRVVSLQFPQSYGFTPERQINSSQFGL